MDHIYVEEKDKESCKASFGYTAVPFYVIFDQVMPNILFFFSLTTRAHKHLLVIVIQNGNIYRSGEPKSFDLVAELNQLLQSKHQPAAAAAAPSGGLTFDEDF